MNLKQYLREQHKNGKHPSILVSTDLEPDDIMAIYALIADLHECPRLHQSSHSLTLTFLVGEGDSSIKVVRMQKMISYFQHAKLLDETINMQIIQGFGSDKFFGLDGEELTSKQEIVAQVQALELKNGTIPEEHKNTLDQLATIFRENPETFVLGIKPPREFIDLCCAEETALLMKQAIYFGTFSFNIRTIMKEAGDFAEKAGGDKQAAILAAQSSIVHFLNAFRTTYYVESFFALGSKNSLNEKKSTALFQEFDRTGLGKLFSRLMKNWNTDVLGSDPQKIAKFAKNEEARAQILKILAENWSAEKEELVRSLVSFASIINKDVHKQNAAERTQLLMTLAQDPTQTAKDRLEAQKVKDRLAELMQVELSAGVRKEDEVRKENSAERDQLLMTLAQNPTEITEDRLDALMQLELCADEAARKTEEDGVSRKLKKWKNITENGASFIIADPVGALAALDDVVSPLPVQAMPFDVSFNDSLYTVLSVRSQAASSDKTLSAPVWVIVPGKKDCGLTPELFCTYLQLNEKKAKIEAAIKKAKENGEPVSPNKELTLASIITDLKKLPPIQAMQDAVYKKADDLLYSAMWVIYQANAIGYESDEDREPFLDFNITAREADDWHAWHDRHCERNRQRQSLGQ